MKSKKKLFLVITAVFLLVLVGGVSYSKFKNVNKETSDNKVEDSKGVFNSIKDALSKNITLVCEFKDDGGSSVKSYIKNGAVRVTTTNQTEASQSGEIIIKDKKMHMWDVKSKQGFVYDIPDSDDSSVGMSGTEVAKSEAYLDMIDKYKDSCKVSNVDDSYFELPSDIKFQDMAKFLEDLKSQMPQGFELPNQ